MALIETCDDYWIIVCSYIYFVCFKLWGEEGLNLSCKVTQKPQHASSLCHHSFNVMCLFEKPRSIKANFCYLSCLSEIVLKNNMALALHLAWIPHYLSNHWSVAVTISFSHFIWYWYLVYLTSEIWEFFLLAFRAR